MLAKEVQLDFGQESRSRGAAFTIKRSKTKNLNLKSHRSVLEGDLSSRKKKLLPKNHNNPASK